MIREAEHLELLKINDLTDFDIVEDPGVIWDDLSALKENNEEWTDRIQLTQVKKKVGV